MRASLSALLLAGSLSASAVSAQSPMPVLVPAASLPTVAQAKPATVDDANSATLLKALQELKATNDETLQKQKAILLQLDEIEKNAEQLRIFARRS